MKKRVKIGLLFLSILCFLILAVNVKTGSTNGVESPVSRIFKKQSLASKPRTNSDRFEETVLRSYPLDLNRRFDESGSENSSNELTEVTAKNTLSIDITNNKVLFQREPGKRVLIASLTKIMTAVVALEHKDISDKITISEKAASIGENTMSISEGETYTLEELLYGLVLHSGNDAAVAIAEGVAGSEENFVEWMNIKARELGLESTTYSDPSGLDDKTYSSAWDLARLTMYALKNPDFKKIVSTLDYEIPYVAGEHKYLSLSNQTNLLRTYPGVKGVKTGFTDAAQYSLVTYASNGGHEIVAVELLSTMRKNDMIRILDYSFNKVGVPIDHPLIKL